MAATVPNDELDPDAFEPQPLLATLLFEFLLRKDEQGRKRTSNLINLNSDGLQPRKNGLLKIDHWSKAHY